MNNNYKFFQNRDCEFFPCHKVKDEDKFKHEFQFGDAVYMKINLTACSVTAHFILMRAA